MKTRVQVLGLLLVFLGLLIGVVSLTVSYLDSSGFWGYPKDFFEALLRDRGSEPASFGIRGLQFLHYLVMGMILSASGGGLYSLARIVQGKAVAQKITVMEGAGELERRINLLEKERQNLSLQLRRYQRKPSMLLSYVFLAVGPIALILATIYSASTLAFIGLGLSFWGALLFYIRPTKYVKAAVLTSTAASSLARLAEELNQLGVEGKATYLPPRQMKEMKGGKVHIAKTLRSLGGIYVTPPGLGLTNLYEEELGVNFAEVDLRFLQTSLPRLLTRDLEIVEHFEMQAEADTVNVRLKSSIYGVLAKEIMNVSPTMFNSLGCPLTSSIALALARSTGRQVIIQSNSISENGETIEVRFGLLGEAERLQATSRESSGT